MSVTLAVGFLLLPTVDWAQTAPASSGNWPLHNADASNGRYSPLDEINRRNAHSLETRWSYRLPAGSIGSATPIVVDGTMFVNSGSTLYALDAASGALRWDLEVEPSFVPGGRGPAYGDGTVYATGRSMLYAVNARTGELVPSFGKNGVLNVLREALEFKDPGRYSGDFDATTVGYMLSSSPTYEGGMLYMGIAQSENLIAGGFVVALNAETGTVKWLFRTIPQTPHDDGWEIAKDTWSGPRRQGGGIWTSPAVDVELGLVFANVANPTPNFDASMRRGINLFTNSIVALHLSTGRLVWHYQAIHHDVWDWDLAAGPTLFEVSVEGRTVKALASLAKTCYVYALNRETGAPIFPIVETPVPTTTDVPGEEIWPTQPIPYTARSVPQTPFCATYPRVSDPRLTSRRRPMFHPFLVGDFVIVSPGLQGGPNHGSSSFSPRTGLLYVTGKNDAWSIKVKAIGNATIEPGLGSRGAYETIGEEGPTGVTPTQSVAAYAPASGEFAWVAELPDTTNAGNLVTAGDVVFQGIGPWLHALDATNGAQLAAVQLPGAVRASPLTYSAGGRQFVAIASGATVIAVGLPWQPYMVKPGVAPRPVRRPADKAPGRGEEHMSTESRRDFIASGLAASGAVAAAGRISLANAPASASAFQAAAGVRSVDMDIDVTGAAGLGETVHTRVTIVLPHPSDMPDPPIVCFAFPGGTYSRQYYTFDMPDSTGGGEAGWHASRGWIFVACDHLGVGESSLPDRDKLVYQTVSAANHATVQGVLQRLADGSVAQAFPAIKDPVVIGIGQSMGGQFLVVQQGRQQTFDGIASLGYSAIYQAIRGHAGVLRDVTPFVTRDPVPAGTPPVNSNVLGLQRSLSAAERAETWRTAFHYHDVPADIVNQDMDRSGELPVWASATVPYAGALSLTPGAVAPEAAAIVVPVLVALGEDDCFGEDPRMEPKAYRSAVDVSVFICPRMAHMHNFAGTREVLWARIHKWAEHVADLKQRLPSDWPAQLYSNSYTA